MIGPRRTGLALFFSGILEVKALGDLMNGLYLKFNC